MKICGVENPEKVFGVAGAKIWGVEMTKPWDGTLYLTVGALPDIDSPETSMIVETPVSIDTLSETVPALPTYSINTLVELE